MTRSSNYLRWPVFFIGMWNLRTITGIERSPRQLKMKILPGDDVDVEPLVQELIRGGMIVEYEAEGALYLNIKNFHRHQKIDRPSTPRIPSFKDSSSNVPRGLIDGSPRARRGLDEDSSTEGKGSGSGSGSGRDLDLEGKGKGNNLSAPADLPALWNRICISLPKCLKITDKRRAHVKARLKEYTLDEWKAIFERIESSPFLRGENGGWKATFDWIIQSPDNAVKILEGKYDRSSGSGNGTAEPKGYGPLRDFMRQQREEGGGSKILGYDTVGRPLYAEPVVDVTDDALASVRLAIGEGERR